MALLMDVSIRNSSDQRAAFDAERIVFQSRATGPLRGLWDLSDNPAAKPSAKPNRGFLRIQASKSKEYLTVDGPQKSPPDGPRHHHGCRGTKPAAPGCPAALSITI